MPPLESRGDRHGARLHDGLVYVSTVPVNVDCRIPGRRRSAPSGRWTPRPARNSGTSTPSRRASGATEGQLRRRPLVPALLRRQGLDVLRHRQPGAVTRAPRRTVGREPARPQPLHRLAGQTRREDRQARLVLPADPARPLRLGLPEPADPDPEPAARKWRSARASRDRRRRRRQDGQAGLEDARSASTTATTTTACWRCGAKLEDQDRRSLPGRRSAA